MLFTVLLLLISNAVSGENYEKCCAKKSSVFSVNNTLECHVNNSTRLVVLSEKYDFISKNQSGFCADGNTDFILYNVENSILNEQKQIQEQFPKCCPLNHKYNTVKHNCEQQSQNTTFITTPYIKIGLPNCEIITDHKINSPDDYKLEEYGIHLRKNNLRIRKNNFCIDETTTNNFVIRICEKSDHICKTIRCIRKCCPDGQSFVGGKICTDTFDKGIDLRHNPNIKDPTGEFIQISFKNPCKTLNVWRQDRYEFSINEKGAVKWTNTVTNSTMEETFAESTFCIEHVQGVSPKKMKEDYYLFKCKDKPPVTVNKFNATIWAKIASIIFLAITIIIYFITNEVRNVFGKILVNYCLSILILFSLLIYNFWYGTKMNYMPCVVLGYIVIYFSTSLFTWFNVCCFDIWYTFGCPTTQTARGQNRRDLKKFLLYMLYGWGVPLILTILILIFNLSKVLPYEIHPYVGAEKCYLDNTLPNNYGSILFKDIPHLIFEILNTVLFVKTIMYCLKVKNEIQRMNDTNTSVKRRKNKSFTADKEKLNLITKLSVIMGLLFVFEVISAYFDMSRNPVTKYIEVVWDTINCLQGVFVFFVFICKQRIWLELKKRLHIPVALRKISAASSRSTEVEDLHETPILYKNEQVNLSKM